MDEFTEVPVSLGEAKWRDRDEGHLVSSTRMVGDVSLHVVTRGVPQPDAVLFLHGLGGDWRSWDTVMRYLGSEVYCVAFDLPGHGESSASKHKLDADLVADLSADLMVDLGVSRCVVIGQSMGALTAVHLAERHELFIGIVLVSGTLLTALDAFRSPIRTLFHSPGQAVTLGAQVLASVLPFFPAFAAAIATRHRSMLSRFSNHPASLTDSQIRFILSRRAPAIITLRVISNAFGYDYEPHLRALHRPVTVINGACDQLIGRTDLQRFLRLVPHAQIILIADSGHWLTADAPFALTELISRAVGRLIPVTAPPHL